MDAFLRCAEIPDPASPAGNPVVPGVDAQVAAALAKAYKGLSITEADVGPKGAAPSIKC